MSNRRDFLLDATALLGAPFLVVPSKEIEQPEDTVVSTIKYHNKIYSLGFEITKDQEETEKFVRYLSNAVENTLRANVFKDPRYTLFEFK